jgi:hypothetical protein
MWRNAVGVDLVGADRERRRGGRSRDGGGGARRGWRQGAANCCCGAAVDNGEPYGGTHNLLHVGPTLCL